MPVRSLLALLLLFAAAGCGSAPGGPATNSAEVTRAPGVSPAPAGPGCDGEPLPVRRSSLVRLEPTGEQRWRADLPDVQGNASSAAPVTDGERALFATDTDVRAVEDATGEPLWRLPVDGQVYGLWLDSGLLVVLVNQVPDVGKSAQVLGVRLDDGTVRWRHEVHGGLLGTQALTGDGGLAWSLHQGDMRTQVLDLASGQVRWTSKGRGHLGSPSAGAGLVLRGERTGVTAYDSATGEVRWRTEGLSDALALDVVDDHVIVSQTSQGPAYDGSVVALHAEDGTRAWTRQLNEPLAAGGTGPGGVVTYLTSSARPAYDLLDLRTGRPRWRAQTQIAMSLPTVVGTDAVITLDGGTSRQPSTEVVARSTPDGQVRWAVPVTHALVAPQVIGDHGVLVLTSARDTGADVTAVTLDLRTGKQLARVPLAGHVSRPAAGSYGALLLSSDPPQACLR